MEERAETAPSKEPMAMECAEIFQKKLMARARSKEQQAATMVARSQMGILMR